MLILKTIVSYNTSRILPLQTVHSFNFNNSSFPINYQNVYNCALMSYNAYTTVENTNWYNTSYKVEKDIKISPNNIKGYVFSDTINKVHVVAIKGTSVNWFDSSFIPRDNILEILNSVGNDKFNDNLLLSCCYYKQSSVFKGNYTCTDKKQEHVCSKECYKKSLGFDLSYINIIDQIGINLEKTLDFKNDKIIFTGHSLGAILATYLGMKYNKLVIGFESPGGKHYFDLVGTTLFGDIYPTINTKQIYHFGHNADTIFMGKCNTKLSLCYIGGYIIRTKCQIGNTCIYKSKEKLGISESILNHRLKYVIDKIIPNWKEDQFPECIYNMECKDCEQWKFT
jgi:lipase ATG15